MNVLRRLLDRVFPFVHYITTDQPDPSLRCPNPDCRQSLEAWTDSAWEQGQFFTRYWRGCPNYRAAGAALDIAEMHKHYAKWKSTSWGTRTYVEKKAGQ